MTQAHALPVAIEALSRIGQMYGIENETRGRSPDERLQVRQARMRPLLEQMRGWLHTTSANLTKKSAVAIAIHYALSRWAALARFCEDGRLEMDNNAAGRALRTLRLVERPTCWPGQTQTANARQRCII